MFRFADFKSPISMIGGAVVTAALFIAPINAAEQNPFHMTDLASGYMVAGSHEEGHGKQHKKQMKMQHGKDHKMKMMDTDGDGSVSKSEYMAHAEKKFARKDGNGDGVLSADEMKKGCDAKHGKGKHGKHGEGKHGEGEH